MCMSWMQSSDEGHDCSCDLRRLEVCLAEDKETKFRSEAAKRRVDRWLAGRFESGGEINEKW